MNQLISKLAIAGLGTIVTVAGLDSAAQAASFNFRQVYEVRDGFDGAVLSGEFSGTDTNANGQIDLSEFTSFSSVFTGGTVPGFESLAWGLSNLAAGSFFANADVYNFQVFAPAAGNGWQSNGSLDFTNVGFVVDPIGGVQAVGYYDQEGLRFRETSAAVPEPMTMAGLAVAGGGLALARRKRA
jgi:hypothetical protein